jgi:hypothetical protein
MSTESGVPTNLPDPSVEVRRAVPAPSKGAPASSQEAQLRARIAQLEAALADSGRCLEDAEQRAGRLLEAQARIRTLEDDLAVLERTLKAVAASKSWRLTAPLRRLLARTRRS